MPGMTFHDAPKSRPIVINDFFAPRVARIYYVKEHLSPTAVRLALRELIVASSNDVAEAYAKGGFLPPLMQILHETPMLSIYHDILYVCLCICV